MRTTASQILSYTAKSGRPISAAVPFSVRPAHEVMGWTEDQKAAWTVARDRNAVAAAEANYAAAFRLINRARAAIRAARRSLAASEIAAMQLVLPFAA